MHLDHNNIMGTVPVSIKTITNLASLRLNDNKLSGAVRLIVMTVMAVIQ